MWRFMLGVGVGAALIYFLDAERGADRRAQANAWARQYVNADSIEQARQATMNQARSLSQQVSQTASQVSDRVSQYRASRKSGANTASEQPMVSADALNGATTGVGH